MGGGLGRHAAAMLSVMVFSSLVLIVFFLGASEEAKPATTTTTIKNTKPQCRPEDYATRLQDLRVTFHRVKPTLVGHVGTAYCDGLSFPRVG